MRILMINICCGTGSTGRICTDLAARLEEAGHEVKIAYARDGLPEWAEKYAVRIGTTADVLCHAASARLLRVSATRNVPPRTSASRSPSSSAPARKRASSTLAQPRPL